MESNFRMAQNVMEKSLNANVLRWNVLSNNIANATTPNFKRSDVKFAAQMERALNSQKDPYPFKAAKSNSKHIPFFEKTDYMKVDAKINVDFDTSIMNNGNNVDVQHEMGESAKTVLLYEATSSMVTRNYNKINLLLK